MKNRIYFGDNLDILPELEKKSANLIYINPPRFEGSDVEGYLDFLEDRLALAVEVLADNGTLYFHSDYRVVHYCKVRLLDELFIDSNCFLNEIIWVYETDEKIKDSWVSKHDTILVYVKNPNDYTFNLDDIDRIPYMAPGLVGQDKARQKKLPTDTWWFSTHEENGEGETGTPGWLPSKLIDRIIKASSNEGEVVLDIFARGGKWGDRCLDLGRSFILIEKNLKSIKSIAKRFRNYTSIEWINFDPGQ